MCDDDDDVADVIDVDVDWDAGEIEDGDDVDDDAADDV